MTETRFLRSQLCRLAQVPDEAMSFWLKQGLFEADRPSEGRGFRRRFSAEEVKLAAFLRECRRIGLNIEALRSMVAIYRRATEAFTPLVGIDRWSDVITDAGLSEAPNRSSYFEHLVEHRHIDTAEYQKLMAARLAVASARTSDLMLIGNFITEEGLWVASVNAANQWQLDVSIGEDALAVPVAIAFDCRRIFKLDWNAA